MTECFSPEVRDHLPDLVNGRLGELDTATMLAHIEACDACAAELELLRQVRQDAPLAPAIDVSRVVAALPAPKVAPVVEAPPRTRSRSVPWKFLATAGVVLIAAVAGTTLSGDRESLGLPGTVPSAATAETAQPASAATAGRSSLALVSSVDDLTDAELEELMGELDNIETIPSAEPAAVSVGPELGGAE